MDSNAPTVVCFGEILWDFLPVGLFPGGAPFNVAYHLHRQGVQPHLVSAVGRDLLGEELLRRLKHWGLDTDGIAHYQGLPTGYVRATLGSGGDASYEIATSVAWDQIATGEDTIRAAMNARAIVFGSLALRSTFNRASLDRLLAVLTSRPENCSDPDPVVVFDVNLRPPHDDLDLVRQLAARTTVLKLNSAEAARLAHADPTPGREEKHARRIAADTGCPAVCVTAGERGAGLLRGDRWTWEPGRAVQVADTVGSGDSFLGTFLAKLLRGAPYSEALARACRVGEWVATKRGATPDYDSSAPA